MPTKKQKTISTGQARTLLINKNETIRRPEENHKVCLVAVLMVKFMYVWPMAQGLRVSGVVFSGQWGRGHGFLLLLLDICERCDWVFDQSMRFRRGLVGCHVRVIVQVILGNAIDLAPPR
jgi:hypothetical protein